MSDVATVPLCHLIEAIKVLLYDNGAVNRYQTEEAALDRILSLLKRTYPRYLLDAADDQLSVMSVADFQTLLIGEESQAQAVRPKHVSDKTMEIIDFVFSHL
jgi:hypothetical protein